MFHATESWELDRQHSVEAEARKLLDAGKRAEAAQVMQTFVNENCDRVEQEYRELGQRLPLKLQSEGIEYLFTNDVKEWTS